MYQPQNTKDKVSSFKEFAKITPKACHPFEFRLENSEISKYSKLYDSLSVTFQDADFMYTMITSRT